jgi:lysophospholipase L1-like esterase
MLKDAHIYRRIVVPITLGVLLLFAFTPAAFAASNSSAQPNWHVRLKQHYLALGDSLAFGFQPNGDFTHGYVTDLFNKLQEEGVNDVANLGCPGETSTTFINGGCPVPNPPPPQLVSALFYLHTHAGKVSPVTLDIGANDVLHDTIPGTCTVNVPGFKADLKKLDTNLTQVILPQLKEALEVNGKVTGNIVMMNYYDPLQNICPNTVKFTQTLNRHLADDVQNFGSIVNVFRSFGGAKTPNPNICSYTWICTPPSSPVCVFPCPDIHPMNLGYSVIANTFADAIL